MIQGFENLSITSQDYIMSQISDENMPLSLLNNFPISKIDSVFISNFKSFKEKSYIGPFLGFTSIIGPNGSGKSNFLDALMFCFCGENMNHSYIDLRDYINREGNQTFKQMSQKKKVCYVQVTFILQDGKKLSLARELNADSQEKFYIDKSEFSKTVYENYLFKKGINPHTANYCITQGQIDKLLIKQPIELTSHIQALSGSIMFKRDYEAIKQQLEQVRKLIEIKTQKISKLKNERKNVKALIQTSKQLQELEKQYELTNKRLFLLKVYLRSIELNQYQQIIQKKRKEESDKLKQINQLKVKAMMEHKQKQNLKREMTEITHVIAQTNKKIKQIQKPIHTMKLHQLQNLQKDIQNSNQEIQNLQNKKKSLFQRIPQVHSSQVVQEYLKVYSEWQTRNIPLNLQLQKKKTDYFYLQGVLQSKKMINEQYKQKQKKQAQKALLKKQQISKTKSDIKLFTDQISKMKSQINNQNQNLLQSLQKIKNKKNKLQQIDNQIADLENIITEDIQNKKEKEIVKRLYTIDGFKGTLQQKIRPTIQKYNTSFHILLTSVYKYLLCNNEEASKDISQKLKEIGLVKTLIILDNVKPSTDNTIKNNLGKLGILAFDIIDYDRNLNGLDVFLRQFCKGKVICQNLKTAYEIRNKNISGVRQIITISGQIVRSDGVITTYGNLDSLKKFTNFNSNIKGAQNQLLKLYKQREVLKLQILELQGKSNQNQIIQKNLQISSMQNKINELNRKLEYLLKVEQKQVKSLKNVEKQTLQIEQKLKKIQKQISQIEDTIKKDQNLVKFMKKHNINNIESFRTSQNLSLLQNQAKKRIQLDKNIEQITSLINNLSKTISNKKAHAQKIKIELNEVGDLKYKNQLIALLKQKQKQIVQVRQKMSKMGGFKMSDLQFKSEIIEMETKFRHLKNKNTEYIESLKSQMSIQMEEAPTKEDFATLQEYLATNLDKCNKKKLQKAMNDLLQELNVSQQKLENFHTVNIFVKNPANDQSKYSQQLKELGKQVEEHIEKRKMLVQKLQVLKSDRKKVFIEFLSKLKSILTQTYQLLTINPSNPEVSGKADIFLQNQQTPFEHGTYYTPTPPTKRFVYDLDQLSGGQKSIASLALQYALAIVSKSPFLILDESDAFLDSKNTLRLHQLIQKSYKNKNLQIILITHKKVFFQASESLVGITRLNNTFSKAFSLFVQATH